VTDFTEVINKIRARKPSYTLEWIAKQCGVGYTTIMMIRNKPGRQPRYELGKALVNLERTTRKRK